MRFRAAFYEGLTWYALEARYGAKVRREPSREIDRCRRSCPFSRRCQKPATLPRLIHTIPDFLVESRPPRFVHVCHWNSRETSHAKFWRTISELAELKLFVPAARHLLVVFEAARDGPAVEAPGWYPEFLRVLEAAFDRCIYFGARELQDDLALAQRTVGRRATAKICLELVRENPDRFASAHRLIAALRRRGRSQRNRSTMNALWREERAICATIPPPVFDQAPAGRLRNASLQLALLMGLFRWSAQRTLDQLRELQSDLRARFDGRDELAAALTRLPISRRGADYSYLAVNPRRGIGRPSTCDLAEDLDWLLMAVEEDDLPVGLDDLLVSVEMTAEQFLSSAQARESLEAIREELPAPAERHCGDWREADWRKAWRRVPATKSYNKPGEILVSAAGMGIYPLVRRLNRQWPEECWTRRDVRRLYSNCRSPGLLDRMERLVGRLASLLPERVDWRRQAQAYLYRKVTRITGAQSAVHPLENLLLAILQRHTLREGVRRASRLRAPTFASTLSHSSQLGLWRLRLAFETPEETVPILVSGMAAGSDCSHKAREWSGRLRLARWLYDGGELRASRIRRAVAVLEGGWAQDDRRALALAGYTVCSLATFVEACAGLGLIETRSG